MSKRATGLFAALILVCLLPALASAQLMYYEQDFESLVPADGAALSGVGYLVFANIFDGSWNYVGGYGPFPAPNNYDAAAFCLLAGGEGDASQGAQQLVTFSDYNNANDFNAGNILETNVFQEQIVGAADVGTTWHFQYDVKKGDLAGASTALAFIKTLDPGAGYAMTNFITIDLTSAPATWQTNQLSIFIDGSLPGQILQFGFLTTCSNYEPSGMFYDNVYFYVEGTVDDEPTSVGSLKSQYR